MTCKKPIECLGLFETCLAIGNGRISWLDDQDLLGYIMIYYDIYIYTYIMLGILYVTQPTAR